MAKNKHKIPFKMRLVFWTRNWVWLVWLIFLPVVWLLLPLERLLNPITGVVSAESETLGAIETVRIRALPVVVGQEVQPGDILVEVEGFAEQQDRLGALEISMRMLGVQQNAYQQEQSIFAMELRTNQVLEDTLVALAEKQMEQARDRAMLNGFLQEIQHLEPLVEQGLIPDTELTRLRPQITALTETLASYPALINTLNSRLASARAELRQIERWKADQRSSFSGSHERTLSTIDETVSSLEEGSIAYLRAKSAGVVSRIQFAVGDVVPEGTPIIRITSKESLKITGLLRPHQIGLVEEGMEVTVVPPYRSKYKRYKAEVLYIEPEVMDLTDPFVPYSRNRFPTRGLRMTLALKTNDHDFIPGESVTIYLPSPSFGQRIQQILGQIQWKVDEKISVWE